MLVQRIRFVSSNGHTRVCYDEYPDFTPPQSSLHAGMRTERPHRWRGKSAKQIVAMTLDTPEYRCMVAIPEGA